MAIKTRLNPRSLIYHLLLTRNGFNLEGYDELWDCTTCATCAKRCPKQVNPMEIVIALRSAIVEKGRIHPNVKTALESTFRYGNPLGMPREDRGAWVGDLPVKPIAEGAEYLYFVGCTPSYDPRAQQVARSLAALFFRAGVDFGILRGEEICCASEVRRLGEAGLYEMMVEENLELWKSLGVTKIVTTSPHCFNAIRNEYALPSESVPADRKPQHGFQVQHYTQLLARLVESGALSFSGQIEKTVTYHDPCYLGKHNGVYDEPRQLLKSIPGLRLVEMDRSRQKSLCCEGGGGRMWLEGTNPGLRLAQLRIKEALETGAEILATACPFCLLTLDEAVKHLNVENRIQVLDIAEIAVKAL
jgi:Fe-S oxidoreductase